MSMFDWDSLASKIQDDSLQGNKSGYQEDTRFYKLAKDKNGNGGALVRFVPDKDGIPFIKMIRINADKGVNNRFCKDWSPQSIGLPDPFNEMFVKLWKEGKKEEAKKFGRTIRYIANIKVIKDPANPENEGKFFLLDMSQSLFDKVKKAVQPTEDELALGAEPKQVFNPVKGNSFLLKIKKGSNGIYTYEDSKFNEKVDGIYKTEKEAEKDIKENAYSLKEFLEPSFYKSYDELKDCLNWFMGVEKKSVDSTESTETNEVVDEMPDMPQPTKEEIPKTEPETTDDDDLDALLNDI